MECNCMASMGIAEDTALIQAEMSQGGWQTR